jgi:hypothetical protein
MMAVTFDRILPDGSIPLAINESLHLEFGHLVLDICRHPFEWTVQYVYGRVSENRSMAEFGDHTVHRYVMDEQESEVSLRPTLADRAVVARPLSPISLMAGATITVYISTPLWLAVHAGQHRLTELPAVILSDTWFGNKSIGELCYSDATRARLDPCAVENLYFKAVTPVEIRNHSKSLLTLDRINVPVTMLPLYRSNGPDRSFITASIRATLNEGESTTRVELSAAKDHLGDELISPARRPQKKQFLYRAFDLFF